ncbi:MAG: hypothetical protein WCX64_04765 [Candidatus Micrarchaeia archaeon]
MGYMTIAGLLLITAGWAIQYYAMKGKDKSIQKKFVLVNCLGVAILVFDGFNVGALTDTAIGNILVLVASAAVYLKIK